MICQACGNHPAIVHLEELSGGKRVHLWLCMECAEKRKTSIESDGSGEDGLPAGDDLDLHSDSPFASFFGQVLKSERFSEGPA
ncbi:MAG: hypothetical protein KOO60_00015, partial [Gemmatimonadales bacterium]|nr:hypothetical protein [Gemmatimonadales bacterium]